MIFHLDQLGHSPEKFENDWTLPKYFTECYHKLSPKNYLQEKKTFVDKFLEDLYLDDSTIGVKILEEGEAFYKKAKSIFQKAGPGLGKWITDSTELQLYFEERENFENKTEISDYVFYLEFQLWADVIISKRVLGIKWDVGNDEFVFRFKKITELAETLEITKRNILMISATFNDALGFFLD